MMNKILGGPRTKSRSKVRDKIGSFAWLKWSLTEENSAGIKIHF